jgi:hypothetical protein
VTLSDIYKVEDYGLQSLFEDDHRIVFAEFVGNKSPKPFLGGPFTIKRSKIDRNRTLFTVWDRSMFNYAMPAAAGRKMAFIAPSETAAKSIIYNVTGLDTWDKVRQFFDVTLMADQSKISTWEGWMLKAIKGKEDIYPLQAKKQVYASAKGGSE